MTDTRQDLYSRILDQATRDSNFRNRLKTDPGGAIQSALGIAVPEGVTLNVIEETPTTAYIVLPPASSSPGDGDIGAQGITWSAASNGCSC